MARSLNSAFHSPTNGTRMLGRNRRRRTLSQANFHSVAPVSWIVLAITPVGAETTGSLEEGKIEETIPHPLKAKRNREHTSKAKSPESNHLLFTKFFINSN